jgi:CHAT domain-containing protein/Tfp pilus assembly protein PilF
MSSLIFRFRFQGVLVLLLLLAPAVYAQGTSDSARESAGANLEQGKPVERELSGADGHIYHINLTAGQFLHAIVDQRGIDLVVIAFTPNGEQLVKANTPERRQGAESIYVVAETPGNFKLEVRPFEKAAAVGRYEIRIEELRQATPKDTILVAAQKALAQAEEFREKQAVEFLQKAIDKYKEASQLFKSAENRFKEAQALNSTGFIYGITGDKKNALEHYTQALSLRQAIRDLRGEAETLNNIGSVYSSSGDYKKAIEYYMQALPAWRSSGDQKGEVYTLSNLGTAHVQMNDYQKALNIFEQALMLARERKDRLAEASLLNGMSSVYHILGDYQNALSLYSQVLAFVQAVGEKRGEASLLNNIALIYTALGDHQKALDYYGRSLTLCRAMGNRRMEAITLNNLGVIHIRENENQKALDYFNQSLSVNREISDLFIESVALNGIGIVHSKLGDKQKAMDTLNQALPLKRAMGDRRGETEVLYNIARVKRDMGDLLDARSQMETVLNITESLRTGVASQQLRATYFATVRNYYEFYIDLLMQLNKQSPSEGYDAMALQASERARARSLLELLSEARAEIREGAAPELLEREGSLRSQLNLKAAAQMRLLSSKHTPEQEAAAAKEIDNLTIEYQELNDQIRRKSPHYAALTQPSLLTLKQIQQVLDADTLLLEYVLGDEKSYMWAVTPDSMTSYELPGRAEIERAAKKVYELLTARNLRLSETVEQRRERFLQAEKDYFEASSHLSSILIEPVASRLGKKRLLIVADGVLQYVPFGALPSPKSESGSSPLIVEHEILSLPSISTIQVLRSETEQRRHASKTVAVLADPVFGPSDPRVSQAANNRKKQDKDGEQVATRSVERDLERSAREFGIGGDNFSLPRLLSTRDEAKAVTSLVPASQRKVALGFDANRAMATSTELQQYRIIHFSTHGLLNSAHPELSGIVLSLVDEQGRAQDGFLRLHDIFNLKLPADLVVLSACQTGLGREIKGEGLIGLTRGFMYAGAVRVMASLWKVDDEATAELMTLFYEAMLKKGQKPGEALRTAQVAMRQQKRWQSPFYWAAFVLQGEWK